MKYHLSEVRVCGLSFFTDCVLSAMKLIFGKYFNSSALFSDGIHSCADSFTSLVTFAGVIGKEKSKKKEKAEKMTVLFICAALLTAGMVMAITAIKDIVIHTLSVIPSASGCIVSLFAAAAKEAMFFLSKYASDKTGSAILYAQAWHHQSDVLSCAGSFVGIIGASLGFPLIEKAASIVIGILIIKAAYDILRQYRTIHG